jgi:hypothetical protein
MYMMQDLKKVAVYPEFFMIPETGTIAAIVISIKIPE